MEASMQAPDFLLLVTIAAAAATPASGQTAAPGGGPLGAAAPGASIPDFSGPWVHPYFPGIEPPLSGPGPVRNRLRRPNGTGASQLVGDYANPILKPAAAEIVKRHGEISLSNAIYATPSNRCWPSGVPYVFFQHGLHMLQRADRITLLYWRDHEVRHVRMNAPHPARVTPSWYGDSVGHYEGDTLVIDTVGVRVDRPYAMVDMYGTPYSAALHVVERYRLIDYDAARAAIARNGRENIRIEEVAPDPAYRGKQLQLEFRVEDEGVFTMPWYATITYERGAGRWDENVCADNLFEFYGTGHEGGVPTAGKPDF
jgi:hypothetical protein